MIRLYDYLPSGNGYKVRLLLTQIGIPFERVELDIIDGKTRTPEFLRKFPNGRIPAVEFEDGRRLFESNAIMWHFAEGTQFLPSDPFERARALQWMFFEQYSHEPYVATPRFIVQHMPADSPRRAELPHRLAQGRAALGVMEGHLKARLFFVGARYSIADIALYAYTHVADEAGLDLAPYPSVRAWLARVAEQPGHIPITWRPPEGA